MAIIKAINSVFPESKIKLCNFHYNQNIEKNRKKFMDLYNNNDSCKETFKKLRTLPFIPTAYVVHILNLIITNNKIKELSEYLKSFLNTYTKKYEVEMWNYYMERQTRTNNACECYNRILNSYVSKKPTFYQFVNILSIEEKNIHSDYIKLIERGLSLKKRYKAGPGEYEIMIEYLNEEFNKIKGITLNDEKKRILFLEKNLLRIPINN